MIQNKYRGMCPFSEEWIYSSTDDFNYKKGTLCMHKRFRDKYGKLVYRGDIVEYDDGEYKEVFEVIDNPDDENGFYSLREGFKEEILKEQYEFMRVLRSRFD